MQPPIVLKIGGNELDQPGYIESLARTLAHSQSYIPIIIVHGGGKEISQMQQKLGITPRYVDGLRVTDEASLRVVEMILCGTVNTRIVRTLQLNGIKAQGLSGMDRGLIRAQKLQHPAGDLGFVGEPVAVCGELLLELLQRGVTPVVAPIGLSAEGALNINADHAAGAIAKAVDACKVIFTTNVRGVLHNQQLITHLTPELSEQLIADGVINGGMLPKVRTALQLVTSGVAQVLITNLSGILHGDGTAVQQTI